MATIPFLALVRKDLRLFFSDRRSVIVAFAVPIVIGSFIGSVTGGSGRSDEPPRVSVALVDEDASAVSKAVVAGARADRNLAVVLTTEEEARSRVRRGATSVAAIIPPNFGDQAGRAFFTRANGATKPRLDLLYDPSRVIEVGMVRGILTEHIMQAVSREMFSGESGRRATEEALKGLDASGLAPDQKRLLRDMLTSVQRFYSEPNRPQEAGVFTMPYTVREEAMTSGTRVPYNGYAHSFAGMGIQFLLFSALNLGIEMLLERQRGLWARLRSAPISRSVVIGAKIVSTTLIALMTLLVSFAFAMIVFHVRIEGSLVGFFAVAIGCSVMAAAFGLLVAALGNTPGTARGVSTLASLVMVMLGGAWIPTFVFPRWLQQLTVVVPVRWAVDGLDATTWRGLGLSSAIMPTLVLLGFAAAFTAISLARFRWEET